MPITLAIETSCDETAAAIVRFDGSAVRVISNVISSQAAIHAAWGGVVPNLAAREHAKNIRPVVEAALIEAHMRPKDIDLLAVTVGPGLMPALTIGVQATKTLAYAWHKPLLGIHHIEGHIYANFLSSHNFQLPIFNFQTNSKPQSATTDQKNIFPLLALVVSGGHTQIVLMRDHFCYEILGETQDDAAGEAFDKVAKILGLPYPGGPQVATCAATHEKRHIVVIPAKAEIRKSKHLLDPRVKPEDDNALRFPRPMINSKNYNFSFSGLKTAVLYAVQKTPIAERDKSYIAKVCYEFQEAVVDVLVTKTVQALREFSPRTFVIAGGVSANTRLRERLQTTIADRFPDTQFLTPEFKYSLDNAAMIGAAAAFRWQSMSNEDREKALTQWQTLSANPNLRLS